MDNCKSNSIVLSEILGSCLSDINKLIPLWHYGIPLPEEEDSSLYFFLNLTILELKQILYSCGLITINDSNIKFVISTSGFGGNYS